MTHPEWQRATRRTRKLPSNPNLEQLKRRLRKFLNLTNPATQVAVTYYQRWRFSMGNQVSKFWLPL